MHRLAERLGYTVAELGQRMPSSEVAQWIAFDRAERDAREGKRSEVNQARELLKVKNATKI